MQYNDMEYRYIDFHFQVELLPESESRSQPALAPSERSVCAVASRAECSLPLERDVCAVRVQGGMLPDHLFRCVTCVLCASEEECSMLSGEL